MTKRSDYALLQTQTFGKAPFPNLGNIFKLELEYGILEIYSNNLK
jgi:hypothetical protein